MEAAKNSSPKLSTKRFVIFAASLFLGVVLRWKIAPLSLVTSAIGSNTDSSFADWKYDNGVILSSTPQKHFHSYRNNNSSSFFREHCQLDSPDNDSWRNPTPNYKRRTPGFLLIGAKKAGTTALSYWLGQHPHIYKGSQKELKYFLPPRFERLSASGKVQVQEVRDDLYKEFANALQSPDFLSYSNSLAFEATPGYLLYSTASRIPIFCALPWIKLLITLRDPVERTYSNYNYIVHAQTKMRKQRKKQQQQQHNQNKQHQQIRRLREEPGNQTQHHQQQKQYRYVRLGGPFSNRTITFEEAILEDIKQLKKAGVLQSKIPMSEFAGSIEERRAWTRYQGSKTKGNAQWLDRLVGRSLYILQLQEWYDAMRHDLGRDPLSEILVVCNEDMKSKPDVVYDRILKWLKLPPINSNNNNSSGSSIFQSKMVTMYKSAPLTNDTRTMLRELFEPYNQRLYDLLGWNNSTSFNRVWT